MGAWGGGEVRPGEEEGEGRRERRGCEEREEVGGAAGEGGADAQIGGRHWRLGQRGAPAVGRGGHEWVLRVASEGDVNLDLRLCDY